MKSWPYVFPYHVFVEDAVKLFIEACLCLAHYQMQPWIKHFSVFDLELPEHLREDWAPNVSRAH